MRATVHAISALLLLTTLAAPRLARATQLGELGAQSVERPQGLYPSGAQFGRAVASGGTYRVITAPGANETRGGVLVQHASDGWPADNTGQLWGGELPLKSQAGSSIAAAEKFFAVVARGDGDAIPTRVYFVAPGDDQTPPTTLPSPDAEDVKGAVSVAISTTHVFIGRINVDAETPGVVSAFKIDQATGLPDTKPEFTLQSASPLAMTTFGLRIATAGDWLVVCGELYKDFQQSTRHIVAFQRVADGMPWMELPDALTISRITDQPNDACDGLAMRTIPGGAQVAVGAPRIRNANMQPVGGVALAELSDATQTVSLNSAQPFLNALPSDTRYYGLTLEYDDGGALYVAALDQRNQRADLFWYSAPDLTMSSAEHMSAFNTPAEFNPSLSLLAHDGEVLLGLFEEEDYTGALFNAVQNTTSTWPGAGSLDQLGASHLWWDDDTLLLASRSDMSTPGGGSVMTYTRSGATWRVNEEPMSVAEEGSADPTVFGEHMARDGERLLVLATGNKRVHVFERANGAWSQTSPIELGGSSVVRTQLAASDGKVFMFHDGMLRRFSFDPAMGYLEEDAVNTVGVTHLWAVGPLVVTRFSDGAIEKMKLYQGSDLQTAIPLVEPPTHSENPHAFSTYQRDTIAYHEDRLFAISQDGQLHIYDTSALPTLPASITYNVPEGYRRALAVYEDMLLLGGDDGILSISRSMLEGARDRTLLTANRDALIVPGDFRDVRRLSARGAQLLVLEQHLRALVPRSFSTTTHPTLFTTSNAAQPQRPTITGRATPGATVRVLFNDALCGETVATADGAWGVTCEDALPTGEQTMTIIVAPGTPDEYTKTQTVTIYGDGAATLTVERPLQGETLATNPPVVTGTARPGATVTLTVSSLGDVGFDGVADENGAWVIPVGAPLGVGQHTISVATPDDDQGALSETRTVNVKAPPVVIDVAMLDGSTIETATPTFQGVGEPGDVVTCTIDSRPPLQNIKPNTDRSWYYAPSAPLAPGEHTLIIDIRKPDQPEPDPVTVRFTVTLSDVSERETNRCTCRTVERPAPTTPAPLLLLAIPALFWRRRR